MIVFEMTGSQEGSISADLWLDIHDTDNATKPFGFEKIRLPEKWKKGAVTGLLTRGCVEINIEWNMDEGFITSTLYSKYEQTVRIKLPKNISSLEVNGAKPGKYYAGMIEDLALQAGKMTVINVIIK